MKQRSSDHIAIKRTTGQETVTLATVLIEEESRRKFKLMEEDSITLSFSLTDAVFFAVGDYIEDELFGEFVVVKEQMPTYNTSTRGYDYSLVLEAPYCLWKNWLFCLVAQGSSGVLSRMETEWSLTDRLQTHAQQIIDNLDLLGITGYTLDITASKAAEAHCITYKGTSLYNALTTMADTWECEWWVTQDKVIHFGKCELTNEPVAFALGDNVERMDISDNTNVYANRVYAYGGTRNVPQDYDCKLIFTATGHNGNEWWDAVRKLNAEMFDIPNRETTIFYQSSFAVNSSGTTTTLSVYSTFNSFTVNNAGTNVNGRINFDILNNVNTGVQFTILLRLYQQDNVTVAYEIYTESGEMNTPQLYRSLNIDYDIPEGVYGKFGLEIVMTNTGTGVVNIVRNRLSSSLYATKKGVALSTKLMFNETEYDITFNPNNLDFSTDESMRFIFDNGTPTGWIEGSSYMLPYLNFKVPIAYYTPDYSVGTLSKVGEKRIHLPLSVYPNRYMDSSSVRDNGSQLIEIAVLFEEIYPKLDLLVSEVRSETLRKRVTNDDGSYSYENEFVWYVKCTKTNGTAFNFKKAYILDKLEICFTAPVTISGDGNRLAGMTFAVDYLPITEEYRIVANTDYGVQLPDMTLCPQVGDQCFLAGWNPRAITSLNLVSDAEVELANQARLYLDAIEQGQFTFDCYMISDWVFNHAGNLRFIADGEGYNVQGVAFYVSNNGEVYSLLDAGTQVTIHHDALKSDKTSRVIGFEYKLDMPYDTPVYTVGETDAFSRIKQIEKKLTKLG